jgi:hypothetical protein
MNERIKELADEAGLRFTQLMSNPMVPVVDGRETDLEKFAELIVQECINIVDEQKECLHEEQKYWHDRDYGYALAVDDASKGIKQFFRVEE